MAGFGEVDLMSLFIHPVVALGFFVSLALQKRRNFVDDAVEIGIVVRGPRNDEGGTGFINQNRVHFVHDGVIEPPLTAVRDVVLHVVAKVIKPEFVVGTVRDVGGIGGFFRCRILLRQHGSHGEPQEVVKAPHPFGVTASEVVVYRHHMYPESRQCVQVHRERCRQSFAFARTHFGDFVVV